MSLNERINLERLQKCNQIWEYMPENEKGRLCKKCSNTIIDFRNKPNKEIAIIHSTSKTKVCGLYTPEQLKYPTKRSSKKKKNTWNSIYIGVFGALAINNLSAQENKPKQKIVQTDLKNSSSKSNDAKIKKPIQINDSIQVTGLITGLIDGKNNTPLAGSSIILKGSNNGTVSDFNGMFTLNLSKKNIEDKAYLIFSYIGFSTQEIKINLDNFSENDIMTLNVDLKEDIGSLTQFYVVYKPSLYKKRLHALKRIFSNKK